MMIKRNLLKLMLAIGLIGLAACAGSTHLTERWNDESYVDQPKLKKVLVLGIFQDEAQRRAFEAEFVAQVNAGAGEAIAGYTLMPEQSEYDEKSEIAAAVDQVGADSVLITSFKGASEQQRYVPPSYDYAPSMRMGYGYGAYYGAAYQTVYRPGYTVTDTIVQLETRVYAVAEGKLVWAGNTQSINTESSKKITDELVKLVNREMSKSGLIE